MRREAQGVARTEHAPGVVERHHLHLEQRRRVQHGVARLHAAQQLAGTDEARIVVAAQRAVASHAHVRPGGRLDHLHRRHAGRAAHPLAQHPARQDQPLERVDVRLRADGDAAVTPRSRPQRLGEHAGVRIDLVVARIGHQAGTQRGVVVRLPVRHAGDPVAGEQAVAGQGAEGGVLERASRQHAQRARDAALHRQPGQSRRAAHAVEVGARRGDAVPIVRRDVPDAEIAQAVGPQGVEGEADAPLLPQRRRLGIELDQVTPLGARPARERDGRAVGLGALPKPDRAVDPPVPGQPPAVDGAEVAVGGDGIIPVRRRRRLGCLGRQCRGGRARRGEEQEGDAADAQLGTGPS